MAFYDWNHNGKKDLQDDYLEYNIYKKCTEDQDKENDSTPPSSSDSGAAENFSSFSL